MDRFDLSKINNKKYKVLSGVNLGKEARAYFNLDLLDTQKNLVEIFVPDDVFSVNSSFFSGLFQKSLKSLGEKTFRERYKFDCDDIIRLNIENGIMNITKTFDLLGGQS